MYIFLYQPKYQISDLFLINSNSATLWKKTFDFIRKNSFYLEEASKLIYMKYAGGGGIFVRMHERNRCQQELAGIMSRNVGIPLGVR